MYFYAPSYTDPETGSTKPGIVGEGGEILPPDSPYPPGSRDIHFDSSVPRFVVQSSYGLSGWVYKTAEQVDADYPGVLP